MLLNARKEIGFTVTLKAVKKEQFKVDEPKDNKDETPEWSWKKGQGKEGQQSGQEISPAQSPIGDN